MPLSRERQPMIPANQLNPAAPLGGCSGLLASSDKCDVSQRGNPAVSVRTLYTVLPAVT